MGEVENGAPDDLKKLKNDLVVVEEKIKLCREMLPESPGIQHDDALSEVIGFLEACKPRMVDLIEAGMQGMLSEDVLSTALHVNDELETTLEAEKNGTPLVDNREPAALIDVEPAAPAERTPQVHEVQVQFAGLDVAVEEVTEEEPALQTSRKKGKALGAVPLVAPPPAAAAAAAAPAAAPAAAAAGGGDLLDFTVVTQPAQAPAVVPTVDPFGGPAMAPAVAPVPIAAAPAAAPLPTFPAQPFPQAQPMQPMQPVQPMQPMAAANPFDAVDVPPPYSGPGAATPAPIPPPAGAQGAPKADLLAADDFDNFLQSR